MRYLRSTSVPAPYISVTPDASPNVFEEPESNMKSMPPRYFSSVFLSDECFVEERLNYKRKFLQSFYTAFCLRKNIESALRDEKYAYMNGVLDGRQTTGREKITNHSMKDYSEAYNFE